MDIIAYGMTDKGMVRGNNEDNFVVADDLGLYVVADGMGGHKCGEVASQMAVDILRDAVARSGASGALMGSIDHGFSREANLLASGIRVANQAIFEAARSNPAWQGMGTTVVSLLLHGQNAAIAHVGDSRAYMLRGGVLKQLTNDHSLIAEQLRDGLITAEEAEKSTRKNIITRALGQWEKLEVDLHDLEVQTGDRFLLCSDGLSGMLSDPEIKALLEVHPQVETACKDLVEQANARGGKDNVTVVVVEVRQEKGLMAGLKRVFHFE